MRLRLLLGSNLLLRALTKAFDLLPLLLRERETVTKALLSNHLKLAEMLLNVQLKLSMLPLRKMLLFYLRQHL